MKPSRFRSWIFYLVLTYGALTAVAFVAGQYGTVYYVRGWTAYRQKDYHEAFRMFSIGKRLQLGSDTFDRYLIASLYHQGQWERAIELAQEHTGGGFGRDHYRNLIGVCRLAQGRDREAMTEFQEATAADGTNPLYRHNLAIALERQNLRDAARSERGMALELSQGKSRLWKGPIALREDAASATD